jgi:hypothetical protein
MMRRISPLNLVANDAERARRDAIVNVLVSDAKMLVSALINASARTKAMAARAATDATWAFPSRRTRQLSTSPWLLLS